MGCNGFKVAVLVWFFMWSYGEFVTVKASPVVDDNKGFRYEEYLIEHEISSTQAKDALKAMNFTTGRQDKNISSYLSTFQIQKWLKNVNRLSSE